MDILREVLKSECRQVIAHKEQQNLIVVRQISPMMDRGEGEGILWARNENMLMGCSIRVLCSCVGQV